MAGQLPFSPHCKQLAQTMADCDDNFQRMLRDMFSLADRDADKVFHCMRREKLLKRDLVNRTWNVKHGAYLDPSFIARLVSWLNENCKA